jgi:hypothetical protein
MPNCFRLPFENGYFLVQRRYVIGCSVRDEAMTVYVSNITEAFVITDPTEQQAFLRFVGGAAPSPGKGANYDG